VIEWLPTARLNVENAADPPDRETMPSTVDPSRNCTLPVAEAGETVAVNVTFCPDIAGLSDEVSAVAVLSLLTVTVTAAEELPASLPSPLYTAAIERLPTARLEVENAADPLARFAVASTVAPSRNWTLPVAAAGVTEAVKVTLWPRVRVVLLAESAVVLDILPMVTETAVEVLPLSLPSPL
jgi:hypothetical protein